MKNQANHPKYYLADVPHKLRRRVLDLCVKRLWQDARDLLHERGFTQYTFDDLQSFYDWAPAELPHHDRSADSPALDRPDRAATVSERSGDSVEPYTDSAPLNHSRSAANSDLPQGGPTAPANLPSAATDDPTGALSLVGRDSVQPPSSPQLTTDQRPQILPPQPSSIREPASPPLPNPLPPSPSVSSVSSMVKKEQQHHQERRAKSPATAVPRRRRGKVAHLPKDLRDQVNARLENNESYESIARWLARAGHPGFNKQNVQAWKDGGHQDWLRERERKQEARDLRKWAAALAARKNPTILADALSNFTGAKLYRLLCSLDLEALRRELQAKPEVCVRYFNSALRTGRISLEAARVNHVVQTKRDKRAPTQEEIEDIERRLNLL